MNFQDDVLWNLLIGIRQETLEIVGELDESIVDIVPAGFNNSIKWNVGHIIYDQDVWFHYLIQDEMDVPESYEQFFGFGTRPSVWQNEPPSWDELIRELRAQPERLKKKFAGRLDEPLQRVTEAGMSTIGEVIPRTLYHEGMHQAAVLALIKSIAAQRYA